MNRKKMKKMDKEKIINAGQKWKENNYTVPASQQE